jgi:hypothetical protein
MPRIEPALREEPRYEPVSGHVDFRQNAAKDQERLSRTGENPPYGMIGGIEETSASFEARSAPRSYPTGNRRRATASGDPVGAQ